MGCDGEQPGPGACLPKCWALLCPRTGEPDTLQRCLEWAAVAAELVHGRPQLWPRLRNHAHPHSELANQEPSLSGAKVPNGLLLQQGLAHPDCFSIRSTFPGVRGQRWGCENMSGSVVVFSFNKRCERLVLGGRSEGICEQSLGSKWWSWDLNLGSLAVLF